MKDYDLVSTADKGGPEHGMVSPKWYQTQIDRAELKKLIQREDAPAVRDALYYYGLMAGFAMCAVALTPSWACLPFWLAYGVFYASGSDARWHECGHATAFKTPWMNRLVYHIACFMIIRNPVTWRWSHARHHTDTLLVGRDAEIAVMAPPAAMRLILNFIGLPDILDSFRRMAGHIFGQVQPDEALYTPVHEQKKIFLIARIWGFIYVLVASAALYYQSIIPLLLIGGPRLYGSWHFNMTGILQHAGLRENVTDHRLNTRTVMMNPISRFLYLNMNYHIEHHMFPMVPYYHLPALHSLIKHDLPPPSPSIFAAYAEILPILRRQLRGENVYLEREVPQ
jgi:fatty acid desaturase